MNNTFSYIKDLNLITYKARKTQNIAHDDYLQILKSLNINPDADLFRVPANKLIRLWKALHIPYLFMYFGYNKKSHLQYICEQIESDSYNFTPSPSVRVSFLVRAFNFASFKLNNSGI